MRNLVLTLYLGVFLALLGLGWLFDAYYNSLFDASDELPYAGYRAALHAVAQQAAERPHEGEELNRFLRDQPLSFSREAVASIPLPPELVTLRDRGEVFLLESETSVSLYRRIPGSDELLSLEIETGDREQQQRWRYALTLLFYAGVAAILLLWLLPLLRGVEQLNRAARRIGEGALNTRVENPNGLYLKPLKNEFNAMAERLQQLNENNRLMSHAVSHELRTPLSRLRFALHLLAERDNAEQRELDMLRMEADLDEMEALINEILNYARIERQAALNIEPLNLAVVLRSRVERRIDAACNIKLEVTQNLMLTADANALGKIIDNLLQNACRHAASRVFVFAEQEGHEVVITVEDDGSGVPVAERDAIFLPFHRLAQDKGGKAGGFGLGLAIVARLVNAHGGSIRVDQSRDLGGACFELRLPLGA